MALNQVDIGDAFKLKGNQGIGGVPAFTSIRSFVSAILPNIFVIVGLVLLFLIIGGGIGLITSAGNPEAQQKSKGVITNALLGFLLVFAAYWIIQIIQVITGIGILKDIN